MEKYLKQVAEGTANLSGESFLAQICIELQKFIKADYTYVAEFNELKHSSKTLVVIAKGEVVNNFEYDLKDTPCSEVRNDSVLCYPSQVCDLFPHDQLLIDMSIEGYLGTPLHNSNGEVIGLIVALYESEIENPNLALDLFQTFSGRISSELIKM